MKNDYNAFLVSMHWPPPSESWDGQFKFQARQLYARIIHHEKLNTLKAVTCKIDMEGLWTLLVLVYMLISYLWFGSSFLLVVLQNERYSHSEHTLNTLELPGLHRTSSRRRTFPDAWAAVGKYISYYVNWQHVNQSVVFRLQRIV